MHIPEPLHGYEHTTLLVIADGTRARFMRLHKRDITTCGELTMSYPPKDNIERTSTGAPGGVHAAEQSENLKIEKERRFSTLIAEELVNRLQHHEYEHLIMVAAHEHLKEFIDALHPDVRSRLAARFPKALINESIIAILKRIQSQP